MCRIFAFVLALTATVTVRGEIRVQDDEVVFSLRAPGAKSVYLIGDFNNWNPTVEPMMREGDVFEVWLFLVEGSYRYKFVVDGRTILDPSNRGEKPELGSPLTLIERAGGFVLSTEELPAGGAPAATSQNARPWVRYIGEFREGVTPFHRAEFGVDFTRDRLRGRGRFASDDETWGGTFDDAVIGFDGGHVVVDAGTFEFRGFEDDSTWHSSDPLTLVGREGVFAYDAGFGRKGIDITTPESGTVVGRVMYADEIDRPLETPAIALPGVDTTIYAPTNSRVDADRLALELVLDTGDVRAGYVRRTDRGVRPGLFAEIIRDSSGFDVQLSQTRERNGATLYWVEVPRVVRETSITFAYGTAVTDVDVVAEERFTTGLGAALVASDSATAQIASIRTTDSRRFVASIDRRGDRFTWKASWDLVHYDFTPLAGSNGSADVHRVGANATLHMSPRWFAECDVTYTDQRFDGAPGDFAVDATANNPWLGGRDALSVAGIVAIDRRAYVNAGFDVVWAVGERERRWRPTQTSIAARALFDDGASPDYVSVLARALRRFARRWFVLVDGRMSRYLIPAMSVDETFWAGYFEVGYESSWIGVNLGFGFDPVVFDGTVSDYNDIGTTRALRQTLHSGIRRDEADRLLSGLLEAERKLETDDSIKLECVIRF